MNIPIDMIYPNKRNPRKNFDQASMAELTASILQVGILQPVVVVLDEDESLTRYRLVAGERRYRAALEAGLKEIPAMVRILSPEQELEVMIIENLQRKDICPVEEANGLQMILESGVTQEELAKKLGCSQSHIANRLRLLELPEGIQENISRGIISVGQAKELLTAKGKPEIIEKVAAKAISQELSVRDVKKELVREIWENSRPLTYNVLPRLEFDSESCKECDKQTMLKQPNDWDKSLSAKTAWRCLYPLCWEQKQEEALDKKREIIAQKIGVSEDAMAEQDSKLHQELGQKEESTQDNIYKNSKPLYSEDVYFDVVNNCKGCPDKKILINSSGKKELRCTDTDCWKTKQKEVARDRLPTNMPLLEPDRQGVVVTIERESDHQAAIIPGVLDDTAIARLIDQARQVWKDEQILTWGEHEIAMDKESILPLSQLLEHWKHKCDVCIGATTIPEQMEGSTVIIREQGLRFYVTGNFSTGSGGELTVGNNNSYVKDVEPELPVYYRIHGNYRGCKDIRQLVGIITPSRTIFINSYYGATMRKDIYEKWIQLVNELPPVKQPQSETVTEIGAVVTKDEPLVTQQSEYTWDNTLPITDMCNTACTHRICIILDDGSHERCKNLDCPYHLSEMSSELAATEQENSYDETCKYVDNTGRVLFVWGGLGGGQYATFYRKEKDSSPTLVKSISRAWSREEAERNLIDYAMEKCFMQVVPEHITDQVYKLVGQKIKTYYHTGGVVINVSGPGDDGFYSVVYKDAPNAKPCWLNTITLEDGVVLCEGKPLEIKEVELPTKSLRYMDDKGRILFVSEGLWEEGGQKMYGTFNIQ
jgi:ParB family chromosome partitioning protein